MMVKVKAEAKAKEKQGARSKEQGAKSVQYSPRPEGRGNSNDSFLTEKGKGYSIELFNFQWLAEKTPSNGEVSYNSVKANQD